MILQIWTLLEKGGILMIPLFLCSVAALSIIIEKIVSLRKAKILLPEIISIIENMSSEKDIPIALSVCDKQKGILSNLIRQVLLHKGSDYIQMREELSDRGRQEIRTLEKGLDILETIATITPILGLLGTVLGMIKVFNVISAKGIGDPALLSGGISEALITTAVGLSIGIPTLIFFNYFTRKTENIILDIEKISNDLMRKILSYRQSDSANQ
ncbi:MAG: MotA/TolQ/ExbB proton channel family protein [Candidatus Cloacimonetes bacterium]|nr:MotA/TolQ/ExbB proton channel family protein [Candidatus Cloacimonadota bacterium]